MRLGVAVFGLLVSLAMGFWLLLGRSGIRGSTGDGSRLTERVERPANRERREPAVLTHQEPTSVPTSLPPPTASGRSLEVAAERRRALLRKRRGVQRQGGAPRDAGLARIPVELPELDSTYLQRYLEEDFKPLALACYQALLGHNPEAAGLVELGFTVAGDEAVGGVVESVQLGDKTNLASKEFSYCVTESLLSVYLEAPPKPGRTTVVIPIQFAPDIGTQR